MATVFVRSRVADFEVWKRFFEGHAEFRASQGATGEAVYQLDSDLNDVTVVVDFGSMEVAKAFAMNPELQARMAESGVVSPPDVWFTERV